MLLSACATSPPTQFYLLDAPVPPAKTGVPDTVKQTVGIGPIAIPALLERKQIVTRSAQNTVQIAETAQWAEPLKDSMLRVISRTVADLQPALIIRAYPWSAYGHVDYRVIIDFDQFDATPGHSAKLSAHYTIINEKAQAIVNDQHIQLERPLVELSYQATVNALSEVLFEFSHVLAGLLPEH
jgi:uncharacterized lipoprotein YmbA